MKNLTTFFLICLTLVSTAFTQDINFPGGRIAMSYDGNDNDHDDYGAMPLAIAMVSYAGLAHKLVFIEHGNCICENVSGRSDIMNNKCESALERFGPFPNCKEFQIMDGEQAAASDALAAEINVSTAGDPLWIIAGGPMHTVAEGIRKADLDKRKYVIVVSHSKWNENYDRCSPHTNWTEMKSEFSGQGILFIESSDNDVIASDITKLADQNKSNGTKDFNGPDSEWTWLSGSDNPDWVWLHKNDVKNTYDVSDAGMTYFVLSGGVNLERTEKTGCETCGTDEMKALFENPIVQDTSDVDGDGVKNADDNCPETYNKDQADADGDGIGDVCDNDWDNDGQLNDVDNCPLIANAGQEDADGDGIGDVCDDYPYDFDNDTIPDSVDNCPLVYNPDQSDIDNDNIGDVCDDDIDGDTISNKNDNCPEIWNHSQADADGDGIGDTCDVYPNDPTNGVGDGMTIGPNYIIWEAESTLSPLGNWKQIDKGETNYVTGASGGSQIEFTANGPSGGQANSPLEYKFTCPKTGTYRLTIRCRKRLEGEESDKCNDGYVKMSGDFESGNDVPVADLKSNEKFFGGAANNWGWANQLDWQGHIKRSALYTLTKGQQYTLTISGRSQRWSMDYILLYENEAYSLDDAQTYLKPGAFEYGCFNYRATTFSWYSGIDGYVNAYADGSNDALAINAANEEFRDKWAAAQMIFEEETGTYKVGLITMQETDGESEYRVKIGGQYYGGVYINDTTVVDYTKQMHWVEDSVTINKGDTIQVEFMAVTNGKIPEGDGTAYSRGRWSDIRLYKPGCDVLFEKIPEPITDSAMVAFFKFENNALDELGNFHGTVSGGPTFAEGISGKGIVLDGSNDHVSFARPVQDHFTFSFWLKTTQEPEGDGQWWSGQGLVDGEVGGVKEDYGVSLTAGGKIAFGVGNQDKTIKSTSSVNDGFWHHVAVTRRSTNGQMTLYVDGVNEASATGPTGTKDTPERLHIGNLQTNLKYFKGMVDEIMIYNYVIQENDVADSLIRHEIPNTIGEKELSATLHIYPNPAKGNFSIDLNAFPGEAQIQILQICGHVLHAQKANGGNIVSIDKQLSPGIYLVKTLTDNQIYLNRLIIQ